MPRPIQPKLNKDHWGFYKVGDYKTYSRLDAIEVSGMTRKPISWNFNNEVFDKFDWTQEPPGDITFWYRQRAEQLREYYDHIVLYYSGGWDSDAILRTFVENNIFIDEIVNQVHLDAFNGDPNNDANYESCNWAIPRVKHLIETNPTYKNTKQTIIDATDIEIKFLAEEVTNFDYFYSTVIILSPAINGNFSNLKKWVPEIANLGEKHNRVCHLWGVDKPRIWLYNNGTADIFFTEQAVSVVQDSVKTSANKASEHDEMFYYTPDMPEIVCKQGHLIKKFFKGVDSEFLKNKKYFEQQKNFNWAYSCVEINNQIYKITDDLLTDIIYPGKNPNVGAKPSSFYLGGRDQWLWDDQAPDLGQRKYLKGLAWFKQTVLKNRPDLWWESPDKKNGGIKGSVNKYSLERRNK